jgi:hypothetical protein
MKPTFFATPADFRAWLAANHAKDKELLVGFYKLGSGQPGGWIDDTRDERLRTLKGRA